MNETERKEKKVIENNLDLDKCSVVAIIGDINTGKTNLGIYQLREYKGIRKIYTLGYPTQIDNFIQLNRKQDILKLTSSIIFIDELSKFYPVKNGHASEEFIDICRDLAHTKNTLIFTTQLTQDLTNRMEATVKAFLITRMADLRFLKLGSKARFAILDCADIRMNKKMLDIQQGEYYQSVDDSLPGEDGIKGFPFQNIGKDWVKSSATPNNSLRRVAESCGELRRVAESCGDAHVEAHVEAHVAAHVEAHGEDEVNIQGLLSSRLKPLSKSEPQSAESETGKEVIQ